MDAWKSISHSAGFVSIWLCLVSEKNCYAIRSEWNKEFWEKNQDARSCNNDIQLLLLYNVCLCLLDCCIEFGLILVLSCKTFQNPTDSRSYLNFENKCWNVFLFLYLRCFWGVKVSSLLTVQSWPMLLVSLSFLSTKALFVIKVQKKIVMFPWL